MTVKDADSFVQNILFLSHLMSLHLQYKVIYLTLNNMSQNYSKNI